MVMRKAYIRLGLSVRSKKTPSTTLCKPHQCDADSSVSCRWEYPEDWREWWGQLPACDQDCRPFSASNLCWAETYVILEPMLQSCKVLQRHSLNFTSCSTSAISMVSSAYNRSSLLHIGYLPKSFTSRKSSSPSTEPWVHTMFNRQLPWFDKASPTTTICVLSFR